MHYGLRKVILSWKSSLLWRSSTTECLLPQLTIHMQKPQGNIILRQGGEEISVKLPNNLIFEIQVEDEDKKHKGVQHSLELEVKWFDEGAPSGPIELG